MKTSIFKIFPKILIIVIGILEFIFGVLIIINYNNINYLKIKLYKISNELIDCKNRERNRIVASENILYTDNSKINDIEITNEEGKKIFIKKIIKDKILVYRFFQSSCPPCVEKSFEIINKLTDIIGDEKIIILSDFSNLHLHKAYMQGIPIKCKSYFYANRIKIRMEADTLIFDPYFFVLDTDLNVFFSYYANPDDSINSVYFKRIIEYLKNNSYKK